jgi:hypothetical protein
MCRWRIDARADFAPVGETRRKAHGGSNKTRRWPAVAHFRCTRRARGRTGVVRRSQRVAHWWRVTPVRR